MKRILLTLLLAHAALLAEAVIVNIQIQQSPTCTHSNGRLRAIASGGVGPYTYLWSTGATTQIIDGLLPGNYSVTVFDFNSDQASNNINLQAGDYGYMTGTVMFDYFNWGQPLCYTHTTIGFPPDQAALVGPAPYFIGGQQLDSVWIPNDISPWEPDLLMLARPLGDPSFGQMNEFPFADADGCPGIYQVFIGWPVEWPQITIDTIQGVCEGTTSGSVTLSFTAEGHNQEVQGLIEPLAGVNSWFTCGNGPSTHTITGLSAGDYTVRLYITNASFLPSSGCDTEISFTVPNLGPTCGVVSGTAFIDNDQNCVRNGNEPYVQGTIVEILPGPHYVMTDEEGRYHKVLPLGSYTVEQQSAIFEEHCSGAPIPFTLEAGTPEVTRNLPDTSLVTMDAMVAVGSGAARPGFEFNYGLQIRNLTPTSTGAVTVSAIIDTSLIYLSATPTPTSVIGNTLVWNQASLSAWQQRSFTVRTQVPPDIDLLGTQLSTTVSLATTGSDGDLSNNTATNLRTITGSYDPNDKLAYTSNGNTDVWQIGQDEWIDYTIRFQNTGTDTAFNVLITDTLPASLDPGSIVWGAASHAHTRTIEGHGILKFHFPNILLPDSNTNEPRSHGFVSFRIRPQLPLSSGDALENIANIYFDFNPPVITDPSVLTVPTSGVQVNVNVKLGGPYNSSTGMMNDQLRTQGLIPLNEPYAALGYSFVNGGSGTTTSTILSTTGPDAIVDWMILELRDPSQPQTIVASKPVLLQRDGDLVQADGNAVFFPVPAGQYHVAVRHRNHLGVMTASPVALSGTSTSIDFTSSATATWGTAARRNMAGTMVLWPGDTNFDGSVSYMGAGNDRDPMLQMIAIPTQVVTSTYSSRDVDLDGVMKYTGPNNDRDLILQTIGGLVPTAVRVGQLP